jgi:hypothetical protein
LRLLRRLHFDLNELIIAASKLFGPLVLTTLSGAVGALASELYIVYKFLELEVDWWQLMKIVVFPASWAFMLVVKIVAVLKVNHDLQEEVRYLYLILFRE